MLIAGFRDPVTAGGIQEIGGVVMGFVSGIFELGSGIRYKAQVKQKPADRQQDEQHQSIEKGLA